MPDVQRTREGNVKNVIGRVLLTALVVFIAAFITPGFRIEGLWALILASIVIVALNYLVERVFGIDASPFGRGVVGFIIAAVILYLTQFLVTGFEITIWSALIGAVVIGIIDAIIPGQSM